MLSQSWTLMLLLNVKFYIITLHEKETEFYILRKKQKYGAYKIFNFVLLEYIVDVYIRIYVVPLKSRAFLLH